MNQEKNKSDFLALLMPNYFKIHSYIFSLVANKTDAEDVFQAAVANMWEHFDNFQPGTNFLSWAFTLSKYQVLTYRKKQQRSIVYFSDEAVRLIDSENRKLADEMDERFDLLNNCMRKLPQNDMLIIDKRYNKKTSIKDIASEFETTANVIYKRMTKIKKALLKCIHSSLKKGEVL